ncbi:MAG: 16S rRNA processing protein RimM [Pseudomonadota bacterium]|nr:16S rRNA processing protein RimM [Pseudomonadota bacterium]
MTRPNLIKIGIIVAPHGIRGEVKLRSLADPPEAIFSCGELSDAGKKRRFRLAHKGISGQVFIAAIEGITERNAAELLKGTELFAAAARLPERKPNQWYYRELTGIEARLADGKPYGKITQVYNFGAGDIVEIELESGKMEMLPFKAPFVGEVRAEEGYVVVFPPDYEEEKE